MKSTGTFEEALKDLGKIVEKLEDGNLNLEESIELYQKGMELSGFCSQKLDQAERRISMLIKDKDGELLEMPFVEEEE